MYKNDRTILISHAMEIKGVMNDNLQGRHENA